MVPWAPLGMQPSLMVPEGFIKPVHQESRLNTRDQVASSIKRGKNVVRMSKNDLADLTLKTHEQVAYAIDPALSLSTVCQMLNLRW